MLSPVYDAIKKRLPPLSISLVIVLFFFGHVAHWERWSILDEVELWAYDMRMNVTLEPSTEPDPRVVIVDIDEKSLAELGRWPWGRNQIADILAQLFERYQVNIVGMDVLFAEPDASSGLHKLEELAANELKGQTDFLAALADLREDLDYDAYLAEKIQNQRLILGYTFSDREEEDSTNVGTLPPALFSVSLAPEALSQARQASSYAGNLARFQQAALGAGHFNFHSDTDSITRRTALLYEYEGQLYEALSFAVARHVLAPDAELNLDIQTQSDQQRVEGIAFAGHYIPLSPELEALVPYKGKQGQFPIVSAVDVLKGRAAPDVLKDKIILLGTTAHGLFDLRATPLTEAYPGVEVHASLITGIMDNKIMGSPAFIEGIESLFLLLTALISIMLLLWLSPVWATVYVALLNGGLIWLNLYLWQENLLVMPIATTLLMSVALYIFNMAYGYFVEANNKHQLSNLFGQYVPPQLVDEMSENPNLSLSLEGENREMTVLFSDVRGFTSLSEGLSPKQLSLLMNTFLTPMTHIIHKQRGTIDKYMGDAIMAFWGAPLNDPDHARHALQAALAMNACLQTLQPELKQNGWPPLKIGIGLGTGLMNVGNMGSEFRMAYTVLGDTVNLGSRLEGLTKEYGVDIIVSAATKTAVPEYSYRLLDTVRVKGKDKPVSIFEPLGLTEELDVNEVDELNAYHQALNAYQARQWHTALTAFEQLLNLHTDKRIYQIYQQRSQHFLKYAPDDDWDGVFTHTHK